MDDASHDGAPNYADVLSQGTSVASDSLNVFVNAADVRNRGQKRGKGAGGNSRPTSRARTAEDAEAHTKEEEKEREIDVSRLCAIHLETNQFVDSDNALPPGFSEEIVHSCFEDIPPFTWDRLRFMHAIENISRIQSTEYGSTLWGNKYASDFTVGGKREKPIACFERLNRFHELRFETDGPQMMFSVITKGVDLHPGLLNVIRIISSINDGGKSHCLTNFAIPTQSTIMKYRGDNVSNKAESVRIRVNRQQIDELHRQLRTCVLPENNRDIIDMMEDDDFGKDEVTRVLSSGHYTSTLNFTLVVDNFMEDCDSFFINKGIMSARVEMRMFRCRDGDGKEEVHVAQSVAVSCVSGVDPYGAFLESMNAFPANTRKSVFEVLDSMVKCMNRGNLLSDSDMRTMLHWITAPSFLCMMVSNWCQQEGQSIVDSDIPVVTSHFGKVVLGCIHKDVIQYVRHIEEKMNQCKLSSKTKQGKIFADSTMLFRGVYVTRGEKGEPQQIIAAPLPPATFSFSINLNEDWNREGMSVSDVTRGCVFATVFRDICDPRLNLSQLFRTEISEMRCSLSCLRQMKSTESRWVMYMMTHVEEQRDASAVEIKDVYLRTIGKHRGTLRMYEAIVDMALKTKELSTIRSTVNLIMHRVNEQASNSEVPIQSKLVAASKALHNDGEVQRLFCEQMMDVGKVKGLDFLCMWESPMFILQGLLYDINRIFRLKNTNLNLLWVLLMNVVSYSMPKEPAWATTIMLVDAACQPDLIVQDKGKTKILGIVTSKRDSAGFNFTQICFEQVLAAVFVLTGMDAPNFVVSGASFTEGKKKRMGLTLALKNDQKLDPEDTVPLYEYGKFLFVSEDCHLLIQNSGQAKNFFREACSKKSDVNGGSKTGENFNKKLVQLEEPRLMLIATNRSEIDMGDFFSLAARIRFYESAVEDSCVPLNTLGEQSSVRETFQSDSVSVVSTNSARFSLEHRMDHILMKPSGKGKDSMDLNVSRARNNVPLVVQHHLTVHLAQLVTLSGFRLLFNETTCVSKLILHEINTFFFVVMEPFLSSDVNEQLRFTRKQEGLMFSLGIPQHMHLVVMRRIVSELQNPHREKDEWLDFEVILRDCMMELMFADMSVQTLVSSYVSNVTYDTVMYVMFRAAMRLLQVPDSYTLPLLVRVVRAGGVENIPDLDEAERVAMVELREWINGRMKFLVMARDLYTSKPRDQPDAQIYSYLNINEHYTNSEGRTVFMADSCLFAEGVAEEEEEGSKNIWNTMRNFIVMIPELQNAFSSFRMHKDAITPALLSQLFNMKKINRGCLEMLFGIDKLRFTKILEALGVNMSLVPLCWKNMSLHSILRDEGNRNSNVFNLVYVGKNSCVLAVNMIAMVVLSPFFQPDNINLLHQLQQRHTTCKALQMAMVQRVPRAYWPMGSFPVMQVDHHGKWLRFGMPAVEKVPYHKSLFARDDSIDWCHKVPKLSGGMSHLYPFYEEETAVCGSVVGMVKRMKDGMSLSDESTHIKDYFEVVGNMGEEITHTFFNLDNDTKERYIFYNGAQWILVLLGAEKCVLVSVFDEDEEGENLNLTEDITILTDGLHSVLMGLHAVPFPRVFTERLVYGGQRFRGHYRGIPESCCISDFGVLRRNSEGRWLDSQGFYTVEFHDSTSDRPCSGTVSVHRIGDVLVGELQRMVMSFDCFPKGKLFLPNREEDGLLYVYHYPAVKPSVVVGMSCYSNGVYEESLETMIFDVRYRNLLSDGISKETDDVINECVAYSSIWEVN